MVIMLREGETPHLIRHQKRFLVSMGFFLVVMIINFPFPHEQAFAAATLSVMNIPIQLTDGVHYLGMFLVLLFCIGMYLLGTSLEKYRVRFMLLALVLSSSLPYALVNIYQNTIATGIYAVDYDKESSLCEFNMIDEKTIKASCDLIVENLSNDRVDFGIRYQETDPHLFNFSSYLNEGAPHQVSLQSKERKTIHLSFEFDPDHLESFEGTSGYVSIQLVKGKKFRNL